MALACALGAERCDIYTDVEGIYTADPRVVPDARKLAEIGYEEMLELAQLGARVMHPRAVELGELYDMPIQVASSFVDAPGTLIHRLTPDGDAHMPMEIRKNVRGIAHDTDVARITLTRVPDRPGIAAAIFQPLADANISVDTIAQSSGADGTTDISFTVSRDSLERAVEIARGIAPRIGAERVDPADDLAKVSIVGTGMQSAPGYAARMFGALAERRHQHRHHQHLGHPHHLRRPARPGRGRRARPAQHVRARPRGLISTIALDRATGADRYHRTAMDDRGPSDGRRRRRVGGPADATVGVGAATRFRAPSTATRSTAARRAATTARGRTSSASSSSSPRWPAFCTSA